MITAKLDPLAADLADPSHQPCRCQPVFPFRPEKYGTGCGYTLIEMLCVLAIVGLLATVALPSYSAYLRSSVMRQGALSLMGLALLQERFRLNVGRYRDSATLLDHRPLPPRVARHYELQVQLTDSARGFRLLLQPRVPGSDYEPMGLDNTGRKWPLHRWP